MVNALKSELHRYKKKYYQNQLIKGALLSSGFVASYFLFATLSEHYGNFNSFYRAVLFFGFIGLALFVLIRFIALPVFGLVNLDKSLTDEEAAIQIGNYFPEVKDKLLNTLQLSKLTTHENSLIAASIAQKTQELKFVPFSKAIDFKVNTKYAKYALPPLLIILFLFLFSPQLFTKSTVRIVKFNQEFLPQAPFNFLFNSNTQIFKGEPFVLTLTTEGEVYPENAFVLINGSRHKMKKNQQGVFEYSTSTQEEELEIRFESSGFFSNSFSLPVHIRPDLYGFEAKLSYPSYLRKKEDQINNVGTLNIPEGTTVTWLFNESGADSLFIKFSDNAPIPAKKAGKGLWQFQKQIKNTTQYQIILKNNIASNKDLIKFSIDVIKDQYPSIELERHNDTTLFTSLFLGGKISDDYGLSSLKIMYRVSDSNGKPKSNFASFPLSIQTGQTSQPFFFNWDISELGLKPGEQLEYYLQVWDNDGVNGAKSTKTSLFAFKFPDLNEMEKNLEASSNKTENKIDETLKLAQNLNKDLKNLQERLKSKRNLDWQDQKNAEKLVERQNQLTKEIEELQKQFEMNNVLQKKLNENPELQQKMEMLQQLMEELLDEELKEKFKDLEKLLKNKVDDPEELKRVLDELEKRDFNLENELERSKELFKQMKFESKMEQTTQKLDSLASQQKQLAEETKKFDEDKKKMSKEEREQKKAELENKQNEIKKEFDKVKEELKKLEEMNKELERPNEMADTEKEQKEAEQNMKESQQNMQQNNHKKASEQQKEAGDDMQDMADKMKDALSAMEQEKTGEDMKTLRQILDNLLNLSFKQEELMKEFKEVRQRDPRFVAIGQEQLKLKDDAKVIEDSLMALAKRVFQIRSFVTREVTEMNEHMSSSLESIKERQQSIAAGQQQLAMTSINNLALLLNDVLKQMQESMAQKSKGNKNCKNPGGKSKGKSGQNGNPSLSERQKGINQKIEQLMMGGKSGRELSEELAKLAAEQEALRKAVEELEKQGKEKGNKDGGKEDGGKDGSGGNSAKELKKQMEKTEEDLVNKRLTQETIIRQREIVTRLLESEKAMKERGQEEKRESNTGKELERKLPPNFEKYLKAKEKQVELLRTISPALSPFYKQESNRYFKTLSE